MQLNSITRTVIGTILVAVFTFASSPILAQDAGKPADQPASKATTQPAAKPVHKHKTAEELCKAKYPDTKSGNYRGCIRYAKRMAERKKK